MNATWILGLALLSTAGAGAQADGGVSYDNHGQELLESIDVPPVKGAPFSLELVTEWARPMNNGGTYTVTNRRPIRRDSAGRIYMERWLLAPKGTAIRSEMSWIQIGDPVAKTLLQCNSHAKVCALENWRGWDEPAARPELAATGPLRSGNGTHTHEDLGEQFFAGVRVHGYRETTTLKPDVMGNDLPLVTVREFKFSPALGLNLSSVLDTPQLGRQTFRATEVSTAEPEAKWFETPEGYRVIDRRTAGPPAQ